MTRQATHASSTPFPALLPPPMPLAADVRPPDLPGQIDELIRLEQCAANIVRATRQRRELRGTGPMLAALEAEALHRARGLGGFAALYGVAVEGSASPRPPALASATTSLASAAFVVAALTLAGYRRLEDLAGRSGDLELLRFTVTAIAEVGGAARQLSRQIGRSAGPTA